MKPFAENNINNNDLAEPLLIAENTAVEVSFQQVDAHQQELSVQELSAGDNQDTHQISTLTKYLNELGIDRETLIKQGVDLSELESLLEISYWSWLTQAYSAKYLLFKSLAWPWFKNKNLYFNSKDKRLLSILELNYMEDGKEVDLEPKIEDLSTAQSAQKEHVVYQLVGNSADTKLDTEDKKDIEEYEIEQPKSDNGNENQEIIKRDYIDDKKPLMFNNNSLQICNFIDKRYWPQNKLIPHAEENDLRKAYAVSKFADGVKLVGKIWSILLLSFLSDDIAEIYLHPDGCTDLWQVITGRSANTELLTKSLSNPTVWPELLALPFAVGFYEMYMSWGKFRVISTKADNSEIDAIYNEWKQYKSTFYKDMIRPILSSLLPNRLVSALFFLELSIFPNPRYNMSHLEKSLNWDLRIPTKKRVQIFVAIKNLIRLSNYLTQWQAMSILHEVVNATSPKDLLLVKQSDGLISELTDFLLIKTQALQELKLIAKQAEGYNSYVSSLLAHYYLWNSGQSQSKLLSSLFFIYTTYRWYGLYRFTQNFSNGIKNAWDAYQAKKSCETEEKIWVYMDFVADYRCTVCGDFPIYYPNVFTDRDCWDAWLSTPRSNDQIIRMIERINFANNVTTLSFSNQGAVTDCGPIFTALSKSESAKHFLNNIDLGSPFINGRFLWQNNLNEQCVDLIANFLYGSKVEKLNAENCNLNSESFRKIASIFPFSNLKSLDLRLNKISNISNLNLADSQLQSLILRGNQISNISSLNLANSLLNELNLSGNQISDISSLNLTNSQLQSLNFNGNQINDISTLKLADSQLQSLDFSMNQISDISNLNLAGTQLQSLILWGNQISDISNLKLANSQLKILDLSDNQISDISNLNLANSLLQSLSLADNQIIDISTLKLANSQLQILDFQYNQISNISSLNLASSLLQSLNFQYNQIINISIKLANSQLNELNLGGNLISDVSNLSLVNSQLHSLNLGGNQISDISDLNLANSQLHALNLGGNQISDISNLNLTNSQLQTLGLGSNLISDISNLNLANSQLQSLILSGNQISNVSNLKLAKSQLQSLDLGGNQISNISSLNLANSQLQSLNLNGNQINDISTLNLANSQLQALDLSFNQISDISNLNLANSQLRSLVLWSNQIRNISVFATKIPDSSLTSINLRHNEIDDQGAIALANVLTKKPCIHVLWVDRINPSEKRALAQSEPNTALKNVYLIFNNINITGIRALCEILPFSGIPSNSLTLSDPYKPINPDNSINFASCADYTLANSAKHLDLPWPFRWLKTAREIWQSWREDHASREKTAVIQDDYYFYNHEEDLEEKEENSIEDKYELKSIEDLVAADGLSADQLSEHFDDSYLPLFIQPESSFNFSSHLIELPNYSTENHIYSGKTNYFSESSFAPSHNSKEYPLSAAYQDGSDRSQGQNYNNADTLTNGTLMLLFLLTCYFLKPILRNINYDANPEKRLKHKF